MITGSTRRVARQVRMRATRRGRTGVGPGDNFPPMECRCHNNVTGTAASTCRAIDMLGNLRWARPEQGLRAMVVFRFRGGGRVAHPAWPGSSRGKGWRYGDGRPSGTLGPQSFGVSQSQSASREYQNERFGHSGETDRRGCRRCGGKFRAGGHGKPHFALAPLFVLAAEGGEVGSLPGAAEWGVARPSERRKGARDYRGPERRKASGGPAHRGVW